MKVLPYYKTGQFLKNLLLICCLAAVLQERVSAQEQPGADSISTDIAPRADTIESAGPAADTPVLRSVPDSVIRALKKKKAFAYANDPAYWNRRAEDSDNAGNWYRVFLFLRQQWVRNLVYLVMVGILLFVVYRLVLVNRLYLFYSGGGGKKDADRRPPPATAMDEDYDCLIREAETTADYRGGTRWLYLKALQQLHRRGIIRYRNDATNGEYMTQAEAHPSAELFRELTRLYEYTWYGERKIAAPGFEQVKILFHQFYSTL